MQVTLNTPNGRKPFCFKISPLAILIGLVVLATIIFVIPRLSPTPTAEQNAAIAAAIADGEDVLIKAGNNTGSPGGPNNCFKLDDTKPGFHVLEDNLVAGTRFKFNSTLATTLMQVTRGEVWIARIYPGLVDVVILKAPLDSFKSFVAQSGTTGAQTVNDYYNTLTRANDVSPGNVNYVKVNKPFLQDNFGGWDGVDCL